MLSNTSRFWLLGAWSAVVALTVAWSVSAGANLSTSALLVILGIAPVVVMVLIGAGAPSPTVAEILHSVHTKDGRA